MVSVLIATINDPLLVGTIKSLKDSSSGDIEFIVVNDGGKPLKVPDALVINHDKVLGRRVSFNQAALLAKGQYLLIIDPHCSMTKDWDTKMIESVKENNLVYSVIRDMDENTWNYRPGDYLHVSMNRQWTEKWWALKKLKDCKVEEESMCFTGCGWMISKKRYFELGGYDEALGKYGWDGPEWSCKTWFNGGKVILRTDVICGHVFGTNDSGRLYVCSTIPKQQYVDYMTKKWGNRINELLERFAPVPDWHDNSKGYLMKTQDTKRKIVLRWTDETVDRDNNDTIVKKVITHYEYVYTDNGTKDVDRRKLLETYYDKRKKVSEEVWTLQNGQLKKSA